METDKFCSRRSSAVPMPASGTVLQAWQLPLWGKLGEEYMRLCCFCNFPVLL